MPLSSEWFFVLLNTTAQAGLSTLLSVVLGAIGALGLSAFQQKQKKLLALEFFCLLPALLPPLVTVFSYMSVTELFFRFPFSLLAVITTHVLMNTGLCAVFFYRTWQARAGLLPAYAFLHGSSRLNLLKKWILFEFKKDTCLIFLLIFAFCFTSFSVPLLVGGVGGQTFEVFIAEKLKIPSKWPSALTLFGLQTVFIFIFFLLIYGKNHLETTTEKPNKLYLLSSWPFIVLPILPSLLIIIGLFINLSDLKSAWSDLLIIKSAIVVAWAQSLLVGIGVGLFTLFLLFAVAFCLRDWFLRQFLTAYIGASTAFMGFAFLLLGSDSNGEVWLKWCLGLSLLFLPALYRLRGESVLLKLKTQIESADLMGASLGLSFRKIVYPECWQEFWFLAGVASFWAVGDFAYSSIVTGDQTHLALLISRGFGLLSSFVGQCIDMAFDFHWGLMLFAFLFYWCVF